jgi:hypothetical protein
MLRFYSISSSVAVASAFSTAAALIVVSGVKQKEAITTCENVSDLSRFFTLLPLPSFPLLGSVKPTRVSLASRQTYYGSIPTGTATTSLATESDTICRIFALVDIGCLA